MIINPFSEYLKSLEESSRIVDKTRVENMATMMKQEDQLLFTAGGDKKIWAKTRNELKKEMKNIKDGGRYSEKNSEEKTKEYYMSLLRNGHKTAVKNALKIGLNVPKEVLQDYPDLMQ